MGSLGRSLGRSSWRWWSSCWALSWPSWWRLLRAWPSNWTAPSSFKLTASGTIGFLIGSTRERFCFILFLTLWGLLGNERGLSLGMWIFISPLLIWREPLLWGFFFLKAFLLCKWDLVIGRFSSLKNTSSSELSEVRYSRSDIGRFWDGLSWDWVVNEFLEWSGEEKSFVEWKRVF